MMCLTDNSLELEKQLECRRKNLLGICSSPLLSFALRSILAALVYQQVIFTNQISFDGIARNQLDGMKVLHFLSLICGYRFALLEYLSSVNYQPESSSSGLGFCLLIY